MQSDKKSPIRQRHTRRPSGIAIDAIAKSPLPKAARSAAELHTSTASQDRSEPAAAHPTTAVQPPTPVTPSGEPVPSTTKKPEKTTVVMNIHMAAAFDREPVVTDLREIPWAKQGDIIAVRPVDRREWEPNPPQGSSSAGDALGAGSKEDVNGSGAKRRESVVENGKRTTRSERNRRGPKGHFLFRLGGNDETKLKKLQQVSSWNVG